jgi:hypothetical protein
MSVNIKVIRFSDLVRANPHGPASLELGEQLLRDIAQAGARLEDFQVLVDTRSVTEPLTAAELWQLSEKLAPYRGKLGDKIAIVSNRERIRAPSFLRGVRAEQGVQHAGFRVLKKRYGMAPSRRGRPALNLSINAFSRTFVVSEVRGAVPG